MSSRIQATLLVDYLDQESYKNDSTWFKRQVIGRVDALTIAVAAVAAAAIDGVVGVVLAFATSATFTRSTELNLTTLTNLRDFAALPSRLFQCALRVLNPRAVFHCQKLKSGSYFIGDPRSTNAGILTTKTFKTINYLQMELINPGARVLSLVKIPLALCARVIDFAIGVIAMIGSVITFGMLEEFNILAYEQIQVLQVIPDIYKSITEFINPEAFEIDPQFHFEAFNFNY